MNKNIKYLIENNINFNPADYNDENDILITNQTVTNILNQPETTEQLQELVVKRLITNPENPYLLDIDTSNIKDMSFLFCDSRYNIQGNKFFEKYNVHNIDIKKLDLSSWKTSKVTDMSGMFSECKSLVELDLSSFDTSNVNNMEWMFSECKSLKQLDISCFDTSEVTDMSGMFSECKLLTELDLSNFNTFNVNNMTWMFSECYKLKKLDLSSFDTSNVKRMSNMFDQCRSLETTDFSNFTFENLRDTITSNDFLMCNQSLINKFMEVYNKWCEK